MNFGGILLRENHLKNCQKYIVSVVFIIHLYANFAIFRIEVKNNI
jgi:hypothetical protein